MTAKLDGYKWVMNFINYCTFRLEMDYELCSAQLRDMTEQRECSRAQAERLMAELTNRECTLKTKEVKKYTIIIIESGLKF